MFFRAYVGKSYTDHDNLKDAQKISGAVVVAVNGGVMVPVSQAKIPDLPSYIIPTIIVLMVAIPSYFAYLIWQLIH